MRLDWYTLTYNEQDVVPYVVDYWRKLISDGIDLHVYIYDNYSTDNTVKLLSQYPWITIRYFKTDGMNDIVQAQIKNNCWQESKGRADYVCLSDFDEMLWGDLSSVLQEMKENGCNVLGTPWYAFCGSEMPEYTEGKYLHQLVKRGYKQYINHSPQFKHLGKFMILDPNITESTHFSVGCHILYDIKPYFKLHITDKVTAFHINKGLSEDYFFNKRNKMGKRLSDTNLKYKMCVEYTYPEDKIRQEYRDYQAQSIDISSF